MISKTLTLSIKNTLDRKHSKVLKAGGYGVAGTNMHHFAWTQTGGIVQVNMMGPFAITYINPADDPSHKK